MLIFRETNGGMKDRFRDWGVYAAGFVACVACLLPFRLGEYELAYLADDFFYYARIAENFADSGSPTFDGITLTNGYHPLWLWLLAIVWKAFSAKYFFWVVNIAIVVGTVSTYMLVTSICRRWIEGRSAVRFFALWLSCFYLYIARTGMEVVLTVPIFLLGMRYVLDENFEFTPQSSFAAGLFSSIVILSRLDVSLLLGGIGLLYLLLGDDSKEHRSINAVCALTGLFPVVLYAISNKYFFGTFATVSALAKRMKHGLAPDYSVIGSLFSPFGPGVLVFVVAGLVITVLGICCYPLVGKQSLSNNQRLIISGTLVFPLPYYLLLSMTSQWRLFTWYDYPLIFSCTGTFLVIGILLKNSLIFTSKLGKLLATIVTVVFYLAYLAGLKRPPQMRGFYADAVDIRNFAKTHPGRYAMGDRAGIVGYLLPNSLIQLEGLVMDKSYLENIRQERNLITVLRAYGIRYYITTDNITQSDGCFLAVEPARAGEDSAKMYGSLCSSPVAKFANNGETTTDIFDLVNEAH